jgi:hypothetical protein
VPLDYVQKRLDEAGGDEINSGKFASDDSSAALAVNTFAWFHSQPTRLPSICSISPWTPTVVDVEYCARFPWAGGRHPWLDACVETSETIVGIESKRYEPFRDKKVVSLSNAYDRDVWGKHMGPFEVMRDSLRSGEERFDHLDAAQLVKHAFGLVTEGRKKAKVPYLVYLFAEPKKFEAKLKAHRQEIDRFEAAVAGAEVQVRSISYRDWFATWPDTDVELSDHRRAVIDTFQP